VTEHNKNNTKKSSNIITFFLLVMMSLVLIYFGGAYAFLAFEEVNAEKLENQNTALRIIERVPSSTRLSLHDAVKSIKKDEAGQLSIFIKAKDIEIKSRSELLLDADVTSLSYVYPIPVDDKYAEMSKNALILCIEQKTNTKCILNNTFTFTK
jgi:hypothetical protein